MMSPTYFAVRNARLDEDFEAARFAGDLSDAAYRCVYKRHITRSNRIESGREMMGRHFFHAEHPAQRLV
jgi:hypothetical protein